MTKADRLGRPVVPGLVLERYRPEESLGVGGSAEVWQGTDERLGRPVAIKLLHPHLLRDEAARERFEREARAAAGLSHPGIVGVYDVDASPSGAAIVLELVEGETLSERLAREGALPPAEVARIGAELAEALQHAHDRGVVHRDVKPGNVLLDRDGRARLADFGIARVLDSEAAKLTTAGMVAGTLRYLAPEQLEGQDATPASDLYALGALLYEMAAGRPAFGAPTAVALAREHLGTLPSDPPGVPAELAAVWHAALDPDPARRPQSAASMAEDLRRIAGTPLREGAQIKDVAAAGAGAAGAAVTKTGNGRRPAGDTRSVAPFPGSDAATVVVPTASPEGTAGLPAAPARAGRMTRRSRTATGASVASFAAWTRNLVAARSAWLAGLLAALALTGVVVLAVLALGSGPALLAPGGVGGSPTPALTTAPTDQPTATPTPTPVPEPAGGGGNGGGNDNGGGKGKGKGKGGG